MTFGAFLAMTTTHCRWLLGLVLACTLGGIAVRSASWADDPLSFGRKPVATIHLVQPGSPGSVDVLLAWKAEEKAIHDPNAISAPEGGDSITAYEAQYAIAGTSDWKVVSMSLTGTFSPQQSDLHEKQIVKTRADANQIINDGFFRLTFSYANKSVLDVHQRTVTPAIPFDASEVQVKAALETIETISNVQVFRNGPDAQGGYEWTILFDPQSRTDPLDHGKLPLLVVHSESISALWSGPGPQVAVFKAREGDLDRAMCESTCQCVVSNLASSTWYVFRVRALYERRGPGEWSLVTDQLRTLDIDPPQAPLVPEFVSASANHITFKWKTHVGASHVESFPILSFKVQQKCEPNVVWSTVRESLDPTPLWTFASSASVAPNTSCRFRVQARNANGMGPFSAHSPSFRTLSAAPLSPLSVSVQVDPTTSRLNSLSWTSPADNGGAQILNYEVHYRSLTSSTWLKLAKSSIDTVGLQVVLNEPFQSYTRYVFRVRAINVIGASDWTISPEVLSPFIPEENPMAVAGSVTADQSRAILQSASGNMPANYGDIKYVNGVGGGGTSQGNGQDGLVIIIPVTMANTHLHEQLFFFTGHVQKYVVPSDQAMRIKYLDVYAWGAGGGSGGKSSFTNGGGGAFARSFFTVSAGDVVEILVGGGGQGYTNGGMGGYNGGGNGGQGAFRGGGGGGMSEIRINSKTVLIAAGGGGGGSTDYCCAHGGGGGGAYGENGLAPNATSIPLDNRVTGIPRDEYHSSFVEGDMRDFEGLPARHQHLDYGFAPAADYSVLATGGQGASNVSAGQPGQASSYAFSRFGKALPLEMNPITTVVNVFADLSAFKATGGRRNLGGHGQDGKDCGGGGGAGYYGGGGGGAGVDGGGGGGGSSFVSFVDVYNDGDGASVPSDALQNLALLSLDSRTLLVQWEAPHFGFTQEVLSFALEMANGSASEDFRVISVLPPQQFNYTVKNLQPVQWYRLRLKLLNRESSGAYSAIKSILMPADAVNTWRRITARIFSEEGTRAGLRSTDVPSSTVRSLPSARRGHSLSVIGSFMFLFGGYSSGYECLRAAKDECTNDRGVNNELWRFDVRTEMWMEIQPVNGILPPAREKHSAAVIAGRLLVFGGRNQDPLDAKASLSDLWEMNPTTTFTTSLKNLQTNLPIQPGKELFTVGAVTEPSDQCVAQMRVHVNFTHSCLQHLRIQLLGPGPSTFPYRMHNTEAVVSPQAEVTWSDTAGFQPGNHRVNPSIPSARSFPVTLFEQQFATDPSCLTGSRTLTFAMDAPQSFSSTHFPVDGATKPLESLKVFYNLPANGGWTLMVADTVGDANVGTSGSLDAWDIEFTLQPCVPTFTWTNLAANVVGSKPSARYQHVAFTYQNSMFIYGGRNDVDLSQEVYRFDYIPSTASGVASSGQWVKLWALSSDNSRPFLTSFGSLKTLITPFHLLALGNTPAPHQRASHIELYQKQVHEQLKSWTRVDFEGVDQLLAAAPLDFDGSFEHHHLMFSQTSGYGAIPQARSFAGAAYFEDNLHPPRIFLFGGQDDTTLLGDWWELQLGNLAQQKQQHLREMEQKRRDICNWRLNNDLFQQMWGVSCGSSTDLASCDVSAPLLYAWCTGAYQTM